MGNEYRLLAIVPAAGVGARAAMPSSAPAVPKQYRSLRGEPMLRHAVRALLAEPRIAQVCVAVSAEDAWAEAALASLERVSLLRCGGPTRAETVGRALAQCGARDQDWVLVHDAARPGLPAAVLRRLIDACLRQQRGGIAALPVADTVKRQRGEEAVIAETVPRTGLWQAQTPQMFRCGELSAALRHAARAGLDVTDEASALEAMGVAPLLVRGALESHKVTWPEDFSLMEKLLHA